jgi:hypothetical protein
MLKCEVVNVKNESRGEKAYFASSLLAMSEGISMSFDGAVETRLVKV